MNKTTFEFFFKFDIFRFCFCCTIQNFEDKIIGRSSIFSKFNSEIIVFCIWD